jgi:hypothetical protein
LRVGGLPKSQYFYNISKNYQAESCMDEPKRTIFPPELSTDKPTRREISLSLDGGGPG